MTSTTHAPVVSDEGRTRKRRLARRQIAVFLTTTFGLTAASTTVGVALGVDVRRISEASLPGQLALYGQALWPLVGAVVSQLATTGTLRRPGWGFRRTSWRHVGAGWLFGALAALAAPVLVLAAGLAGFSADGALRNALLALTVLTLPYVVLALAEDVGWRGVLVTRLAELGGPRLVVLGSGLAWAAFHWPLVLLLGGTPEGVPRLWALVMFTIGTTGLGAVLAWMQLRWGQWPGIVAHAVVNALGYHLVAPALVETEHTNWFATETGLAGALVFSAAAVVWLTRAPLRHVGDQTMALGRRDH